eukprot:m.120391 g.120391  ORF g.120391 m.120391 type:complete len:888 (+) comp23232_c0_seq1:57-2720(+)
MASWEAYVTITIIIGMLLVMSMELGSPDMVMMAGLTMFLALGIVTTTEAVQGFSNTGMLTVAFLFAVAAGVKKTGAINPVKRLLERSSSGMRRQGGQHSNRAPRGFGALLLRVISPVAVLSAFLNNTPVVAMMIPLLTDLGRKFNISPSKLLIPLSYASIFGGTCTLIGTSTNLVVLGLAQERDPNFTMGIFDISVVGIPVLLAGILYLTLFAFRLLPNRMGLTQSLNNPREYMTVMVVTAEPEEGGSAQSSPDNTAANTLANAQLKSMNDEEANALALRAFPRRASREASGLQREGTQESFATAASTSLQHRSAPSSRRSSNPGSPSRPATSVSLQSLSNPRHGVNSQVSFLDDDDDDPPLDIQQQQQQPASKTSRSSVPSSVARAFSRGLLTPPTRRRSASGGSGGQPGNSATRHLLVGKSIADAGLRNLPGLFLVQIERGTTIIPAPGPEVTLAANDKLYFAGIIDSVLNLSQMRGLHLAEQDEGDINLRRMQSADEVVVEAVVAPRSELVHHTVRDLKFRRTFKAAILAVHRHGVRIDERIGDIVLEGGDTLLLLANKDFLQLHGQDPRFALVSRVQDHQVFNRRKAHLATLITLAMIGASLGGVNLLLAAMVAIAAMVMTKCLKANDVRDSINLQVLTVIAAAFGVSEALVQSGAAKLLADGLIAAAQPTGLTGLYIVVYCATVLFSAAVTNNAAVTIMFPVAFQAAEEFGTDFKPFIYLLMMGASASFMTPTGYQTNLMVYGPGGYKFVDYLKFGVPLQFIVAIVSIGVVVTWNFWWLWVVVLLLANIISVMLSYVSPLGNAASELSGELETGDMNLDLREHPHGGQGRREDEQEHFFFQPDLGLERITTHQSNIQVGGGPNSTGGSLLSIGDYRTSAVDV